MEADLVFAAAHHVLAFLLVSTLAVELTLVRPGMTPEDVRLVPRIDAMYGVIFVLLLAAGLGRVWLGGMARYMADAMFWAKMGALLLTLLASLPPTFAFLRWRNRGSADTPYVPQLDEIRQLRRYMHVQAALLVTVPVLAALLARGYGFW
jgi:putative membrane protein